MAISWVTVDNFSPLPIKGTWIYDDTPVSPITLASIPMDTNNLIVTTRYLPKYAIVYATYPGLPFSNYFIKWDPDANWNDWYIANVAGHQAMVLRNPQLVKIEQGKLTWDANTQLYINFSKTTGYLEIFHETRSQFLYDEHTETIRGTVGQIGTSGYLMPDYASAPIRAIANMIEPYSTYLDSVVMSTKWGLNSQIAKNIAAFFEMLLKNYPEIMRYIFYIGSYPQNPVNYYQGSYLPKIKEVYSVKNYAQSISNKQSTDDNYDKKLIAFGKTEVGQNYAAAMQQLNILWCAWMDQGLQENKNDGTLSSFMLYKIPEIMAKISIATCAALFGQGIAQLTAGSMWQSAVQNATKSITDTADKLVTNIMGSGLNTVSNKGRETTTTQTSGDNINLTIKAGESSNVNPLYFLLPLLGLGLLFL